MSLIICSECNKEISEKARTCPNCGLPLSSDEKLVIDNNSEIAHEQPILCPNTFPKNLSIGKQITNWKLDAAFEGIYNQAENVIGSINSGKVKVMLHTHGVRIWSGINMYDIHNSQIINIVKTSSAELVQANKSVLGRAVVGALIMGPLGAVVGGMSGISAKEKLQIRQYLVINFWEIDTRTSQSILIQCDEAQPISSFIERQKQENSINLSQHRVAEKESTPIWAIICVFVIILSILTVIFV